MASTDGSLDETFVRSLASPEQLEAFHRFCETCEDFDSGGYDVPKDMMKNLAQVGLVRSCGFGRYQTTLFGDKVRDLRIA